MFFVKKWTFPQRRVHYVQCQYFFYILLIWGVRTGLEQVLKDGESASWPLEGMDDQYDKLASPVCSVGHKSTN